MPARQINASERRGQERWVQPHDPLVEDAPLQMIQCRRRIREGIFVLDNRLERQPIHRPYRVFQRAAVRYTDAICPARCRRPSRPLLAQD